MIKDWLAATVAAMLPRRVVYFAAIRLGAAVTTGKYAKTVVPELTFIDALKRWDPRY